MISRYEVSQIINDALKPELKELHPYSKCFNRDLSLDMYVSIHDLAVLAKAAAVSNDRILYKQCLTVAERLYKDGERLVQGAVENVFIYELSPRVSKEMLPKAFYDVYLRQVMNSN